MATQVKFYNVDALPVSPSAGGLYFVNEGETGYGQLYRGSQLIGAARVTQVDYVEGALTITPAPVRGDINISTQKGAEIYKGKDSDNKDIWLPLSDASLTKRVENLEAVVSYSGSGDKVVTADTITATTGNFTNLNVSDTATFSATTISATTLAVDTEAGATFGGSTISAIADREALAKIAAIAEASVTSDDEVAVGVTVVTQSGSVKEVEVTVSATASAADINKDNTALVRANDVADYIANVASAMHFIGLKTVTKDDEDVITVEGVDTPVAGDLVIDGAGKEYVYNGTKWQELGDETALAKVISDVGDKTGLTTTEKGTIVGAVNELDAKIKEMDADVTSTEDNGVKVEVVQSAGAITSVVTTVDAVESADGIVANKTNLVTAGAVADKIAGIVDGLDASVSASDKGVEVKVVEENGKLTSATVSVTASATMSFADTGSAEVLATTAAVKDYFTNNLVWLGSNGQPIA